MFDDARAIYADTLREIRDAGLFKDERILTTPQGARIRTEDGRSSEDPGSCNPRSSRPSTRTA